MSSPSVRPARPHTTWPVALGLGLVASVIVTLVVLAFLWPTKTADPHDLPVGIAGPTAVVPLSTNDPTGSGIAAASFPFTLGGMIGGILISLLVVGPVRRLAALGAFAVVAGIGLALVLQTWWGYLQGDFWINALAIGLS